MATTFVMSRMESDRPGWVKVEIRRGENNEPQRGRLDEPLVETVLSTKYVELITHRITRSYIKKYDLYFLMQYGEMPVLLNRPYLHAAFYRKRSGDIARKPTEIFNDAKVIVVQHGRINPDITVSIKYPEDLELRKTDSRLTMNPVPHPIEKEEKADDVAATNFLSGEFCYETP